nr:MAG: hypothetical protein E4H34_05370 [Hyphomicrobiales bacterium]
MSRLAFYSGLFITSLVWPGLALAQGHDGQAHSATAIPDFSGGWARIGDLVEMFEAIPGHTGGGPMLVDPEYPHAQGGVGEELRWVADLDNPILQPATLEKLRVITEAELRGIPHVKDEGVCQPSGVPMLLNRRGGAIQILQTPTQITILNARDHQVRFAYLDVPHSANPGHSWYGESVAHYEGSDTLVIDTIGQNDKTQIDRFGTPHSEQLHVIERYTLSPDGQALEVQFTVVDPIAFTMPWSGRVRFRNRPTDWDEQICAENNRHVGTVTFNGVLMTDEVPTPTDETPDF